MLWYAVIFCFDLFWDSIMFWLEMLWLLGSATIVLCVLIQWLCFADCFATPSEAYPSSPQSSGGSVPRTPGPFGVGFANPSDHRHCMHSHVGSDVHRSFLPLHSSQHSRGLRPCTCLHSTSFLSLVQTCDVILLLFHVNINKTFHHINNIHSRLSFLESSIHIINVLSCFVNVNALRGAKSRISDLRA